MPASHDDRTLAESVLRKAQERHPRDVWVNYALGTVLEKLRARDEAIRFYTAARAIRPETAHELAHALERRGTDVEDGRFTTTPMPEPARTRLALAKQRDIDEAIAVFRDLEELRPGDAWHLGCLAKLLNDKGPHPRGR